MGSVAVRPLDGEVGDVADCLRGGGVVLLPTDTVYGLAALPTEADAVSRIFALKGRPASQNLPVLIASPADIARLGGVVTEAAARLLDSRFVPGALTIAVGIDRATAPEWLASRDEAAFRMPADDWLLAVIRATGPVLATSANTHGVPPKESVAEILADLAGEPDLVVDGGVRATVASTLVNCRLEPPVVERVGAVPAADIEEVLA
jgi:L-threonylcarbamoyladenylate synthase